MDSFLPFLPTDQVSTKTGQVHAALNVLDGTVIGRNMQRHRHQEFIRFLNVINAQVPSEKAGLFNALYMNLYLAR